MKVYSVYYIFKDEEENDLFSMNMDEHPTIKWLSALSNENEKPVECDEVSDDLGQNGVEFYFRTKKAAKAFAKEFNIPVDSIGPSNETDFFNPWLEGWNGDWDDVPGFR